jgi:hypothetical protein
MKHLANENFPLTSEIYFDGKLTVINENTIRQRSYC